MSWIILFLTVLSSGIQKIVQKGYGKKYGNIFLFTSVSCFATAIFFVISAGGRLEFDPRVLLYAVLFGAGFCGALIGSMMAIKTGSLSLTSLFVSYSLIVPTVYGVVFFNEPVGIFMIIGLALLFCSFTLINAKKGDTKINPIWFLYVLFAFLGNGMCSTTQTVQQKVFNGSYKSELMIIGMLIVTVVTLIISLIIERKEYKQDVKSVSLMALNGALSGFLNLFTMMLMPLMPASIMFPLISAGGIIVSWLISKFIYKEVLTKQQTLGLVLGILSVVFLNL